MGSSPGERSRTYCRGVVYVCHSDLWGLSAELPTHPTPQRAFLVLPPFSFHRLKVLAIQYSCEHVSAVLKKAAD